MDIQELLAKIGQYGKGVGQGVGRAVRGAGDYVGDTLQGIADSGTSAQAPIMQADMARKMEEQRKTEELRRMIELDRVRQSQKEAPMMSPTAKKPANPVTPADGTRPATPYFNESTPAGTLQGGKQNQGFIEYLMQMLGK